MNSPVTPTAVFAAMIQGKFEPFTETDWYAYAGCDGEGFKATLEGHEVILDLTGAGVSVNVFGSTNDEGETECWILELAASAEEFLGKI